MDSGALHPPSEIDPLDLLREYTYPLAPVTKTKPSLMTGGWNAPVNRSSFFLLGGYVQIRFKPLELS